MAAHYTHSRSAILCFGGWGLQTLLHTAPRIQAAQEQRAARGKEEPDLTRITSFGALLPEPLLTGSGLAHFLQRNSGLRMVAPRCPRYCPVPLLSDPFFHVAQCSLRDSR
jgi:hypothetical protein